MVERQSWPEPCAFLRRSDVEYRRRRWTQRAAGPLTLRLHLREDGAIIGDVAPTGMISHRCRRDRPADAPRQVRALLFWLVALQWRRSARH